MYSSGVVPQTILPQNFFTLGVNSLWLAKVPFGHSWHVAAPLPESAYWSEDNQTMTFVQFYKVLQMDMSHFVINKWAEIVACTADVLLLGKHN